jgi:DNA invertase Pin-like site-specific DNA recombinase
VIVGYCRVSSEAQGADGYGIGAQEEAIRRACRERRWEAPLYVREVASGSKNDRPELNAVLDSVKRGDIIIVARLDRLTRSVGHFAALLDRAKARGWDIVCLDPAVDMTTPYGRAMAGMAAVFAQLERELISQRTKEGLAQARLREGWPGNRTPDKIDDEQLLKHGGARLQSGRDRNPIRLPSFARLAPLEASERPLTFASASMSASSRLRRAKESGSGSLSQRSNASM